MRAEKELPNVMYRCASFSHVGDLVVHADTLFSEGPRRGTFRLLATQRCGGIGDSGQIM